MPASKFFEVIPVLLDSSGSQVGVCAMGPIGTGDTLIWMRVWAWQQDGDAVVASSGNGGEPVQGAHPLSPSQMPPFAAPDTQWMVETGFEPQSGAFDLGKPVLVQALALVENNGERSIVQWSQAVGLRQPGHHADGGDGDDDEHHH